MGVLLDIIAVILVFFMFLFLWDVFRPEKEEPSSTETVYSNVSNYCKIKGADGELKGISFVTSDGEEKDFFFKKSDDINFKDNGKEINKVTVIVKDQQNMNKTKRTYIIEGE